MNKIGKIGLPVIEIVDGSRSKRWRRFEDRAQLRYFYSKVDETKIGQSYSEKLRNDVRVRALEGKMLRVGTSARGFQLQDLLYWLLWRANSVGETQAFGELDRFLSDEEVTTLEALWVYGLSVTTSVQLPDNVSLLPIDLMPDSDDKSDFLVLGSPMNFGRSPAPMAALVKPHSHKKIRDPNEIPSATDPIFKIQQLLKDLALLLNCVDGACCTPAYNTAYSPPEVPVGAFAGSGGSSPIYDVLPSTMSNFPTGAEKLVTDLLAGYKKFSGDTQRRLQQALGRFSQAKSRIDLQDKFLDLGISLEMVLLGDEHRNRERPDQLGLTFRLRGSWLLGKTGADRRELYKTFRRIYELRSQVAHNGFSHELNKMDYNMRKEATAYYFNVGERVFQTLIANGIPSDWTAVVLNENT
jgi:hypothetical protein